MHINVNKFVLHFMYVWRTPHNNNELARACILRARVYYIYIYIYIYIYMYVC